MGLPTLSRRKRNHEDHEAGNDYCHTLYILIPNLSCAADDGGTIFNAKCAMCHEADATVVAFPLWDGVYLLVPVPPLPLFCAKYRKQST